MKRLLLMAALLLPFAAVAGEVVTVDVPVNKKLVLVPVHVENCITVKPVTFMLPEVTFVQIPAECEGYGDDVLVVSPGPRYPAYCSKYFPED